jgi:hypothetical protein
MYCLGPQSVHGTEHWLIRLSFDEPRNGEREDRDGLRNNDGRMGDQGTRGPEDGPNHH